MNEPMTDGPVSTLRTLDGDVPCTRWGYNLRGLGPRGRCPECGAGIGRSMRAEANRLARRRTMLVPLDGRWLGTLHEGAWLLIASMVVTLAAATAPRWTLRGRSAPRDGMLVLACIGWCLGAWR